jgi:hypothetical protein
VNKSNQNIMRFSFKFSLVLTVLLFACKKEENTEGSDGITCPELNAPQAFSNSPVNENDTLFFTALTNVSGADFEWTGPNGFFSNLNEPKIFPALFQHSGKYFCRIKYANCTSLYTLVPVQVNAPCPALTLNTAMVNANLWNFYSGVSCGAAGANGFYGVTATNNDGTLQVIFGNRYEQPYGYRVFPVSLFPDADSATVQLRFNENGTEFKASSGTVYSAVETGKTVIVFCNVLFVSDLSTQRTIGARIGCE